MGVSAVVGVRRPGTRGIEGESSGGFRQIEGAIQGGRGAGIDARTGLMVRRTKLAT